MSADRIFPRDSESTFFTASAPSARMTPSGENIGIEFRSDNSIPVWTEMTMELQTPLEPKKLHCTGVVVACTGNRHAGFKVSMVFTRLSRQTQARLSSMASVASLAFSS